MNELPDLYEARLLPTTQTGAVLKHEWVYLDEADLEAFRVLEYEYGQTGRKLTRMIWPVSPSQDAWRMDEPPGPWPLYRLPELPHFGRVYVCQSESAADALWWVGLAATTSARGCYAVHKTDFAPLATRDVVILPNHDRKGRLFARAVAAELDRAMLSAWDVRVLELPALPLHGGIVDFLNARLSQSPEVTAAEIGALADGAPDWKTYIKGAPGEHRDVEKEQDGAATGVAKDPPSQHAGPFGAGSGAAPCGRESQSDTHECKTASETIIDSPLRCQAAETEWLWPGIFAVGELGLLLESNARHAARRRVHGRNGVPPLEFGGFDKLTAGEPTTGTRSPSRQSLFGLDLAARVSTGAPWPDGSGQAQRGSVVLVNCMSEAAQRICRRLDRAGADKSRIVALGAVRRTTPHRIQLTAMAALERAIRQLGDVRLVLIDPAAQYLTGSAPAALKSLAQRHNLAVVMVATLDRGVGGLSRLRAMYCNTLENVRTAWLAVPDALDPGLHLFLPVTDHSGTEPAGLAYRIAKGKLHWEPAPAGIRADDALRALRECPGPSPTKLLAAAQWLSRRLAHGPAYVGSPRNVSPGSLRWEAKKAGWSWCTLRRAFQAIGAVAEQCPQTGRSRWRAGK